jgi:lipopolysaccharide/colanic/teichoic acid biosynthesis glycosyltransferase
VITRAIEHPTVKFADAVLAVAMVLICLRPNFLSVLAAKSLNAIQLNLRDAIAVAIFIFMWQWVFGALKAYNRFRTVSSRILAVLKGVVLMAVPTLLYVRIFHPDWIESVRPALFLVVGLFAFEIGWIFVTNSLVKFVASRNPRRAVIVGTGRRAGKAWREIRTHYHSSTRVLGFIDDRDPADMAPEIASLHLGGLNNLGVVITSEAVDLVLIAAPMQSCYLIAKRAIEIAEGSGVPVIYLGDVYASRHRIGATGDCIFNELAPEQERYVIQLIVKRLADLILSAGLLIALSPLMLVIAAAIKLTSRGPILIRQQRYGYQRRLRTMYKFRTRTDGSGLAQSGNDPRVTAIGRVLRSTSLDELPKLLNVLNGTTSLVGPRPMTVRDMSRFGDGALARRFRRQVRDDLALAGQSPEPAVFD